MNIEKVFPKWKEEDIRCPTCNQLTKKVRGITKQNLKNLIRLKPNKTEMILIAFFLILILIMYAYKVDIQTCREYARQFEKYWIAYNLSQRGNQNYSYPTLNLTIINQTKSN